MTTTTTEHHYYNKTNFPVLLCVGDANWDYWYCPTIDTESYCVSAIPKDTKPDCNATYFGSLRHFLHWGGGRMTSAGVNVLLNKFSPTIVSKYVDEDCNKTRKRDIGRRIADIRRSSTRAEKRT